MSTPSRGRIIENNGSFGPIELGYSPAFSEWFSTWFGAQAPPSGFKMHVSARTETAEIIARSVLPRLRELRVAHKVVRDLQRYIRLCEGQQRGKFITIYTNGWIQAQDVLDTIDTELYDLRVFGGILPGRPPTTRESGHAEVEIRVGRSGFIFTRWFEEGAGD